jgi:flagellar basal body rod protein FlgF
MKRISVKTVILVVMLISTIVLTVGCSEKSKIVGKWEVFEGSNTNIEFAEDGTLYCSDGLSFPYEVKDGKISIKSTIGSVYYEYSIEGNKLIMQDKDGKEIYLKEGSLKNNEEAVKKLTGKWGIDNETMFEFIKDSKAILKSKNQTVDCIIDDGIIRLDLPNEKPSVVYMEYRFEEDNLVITNKSDNGETTLKKMKNEEVIEYVINSYLKGMYEFSWNLEMEDYYDAVEVLEKYISQDRDSAIRAFLEFNNDKLAGYNARGGIDKIELIKIDSIKKVEDTGFEVTVNEKWIFGEDENTEEKQCTNTYTLKEEDGRLVITCIVADELCKFLGINW